MHEHYDNATKENDIALIELRETLNYSDAISPVCLPTARPSGGEICSTVGWGKTMRRLSFCFQNTLVHIECPSKYILDGTCLSVCLSGCTQGTLYTTTTVYGLLVHHEGAICTIKAQYAPRCTRETMFFEKFRGP